MNQPHLSVLINGNEVDPSIIKNFELVCDEETHLPKAILKLNDRTGDKLSEFYGLQIGTTVKVGVVENDPAAESRYATLFTDLIIASLSVEVQDETAMNGMLQILLVHPWFFFKDYTSHAYLGKSNADIIKGLLTDSTNRGFKFPDIIDSLFDKSDETGSIPRYKCLESDYDFIMNKLLPYTTINGKPPIFWIDEYGNPHLKSFSSCFASTAKAVGIPHESASVTEHSDKLTKLVEKNGNMVFLMDNVFIKIGDENIDKIIKVLKSNVMYENNVTGKIYSGIYYPSIAISSVPTSDSVKTDGSRLPIDMVAMATVGVTDSKKFIHRNLNDAVALAANTQKPINNMFRIEVTGQFVGEHVSTGDNLYIFVPSKKDLEVGDTSGTSSKSYTHWISDKWHIRGVRHFIESDDMVVHTTLYLERPSFMINKDTTKILSIDSLYGVANA